jgi:hypothetical protein
MLKRIVKGALKLFFIFVIPLLLCTLPPSPNVKENFPDICQALWAADSLSLFKGYGEIGFSIKGERHTAKIDVLWRGDSNFTIVFCSPFGTSLASIVADSTGLWIITAGDSIYKKRADDRIAINGLFNFPFTFCDFLQAATGRLPDRTISKKQHDSLFLNEKKAFLFWNGDSSSGRIFDITVIISRKHSFLTDVIYLKKFPDPWELSLSSFKKNVAQEIRFKDASNNYFYLKYKEVTTKYNIRCRRERL